MPILCVCVYIYAHSIICIIHVHSFVSRCLKVSILSPVCIPYPNVKSLQFSVTLADPRPPLPAALYQTVTLRSIS